ncbi:hypothetical protein THIOM_004867 [Candidatus Thiomargarita nelsonii]|uniref:Uncharacterized protein n=1 Tax=Candidatus Thiomargarita nelsonii TaxID=1003181 RepID=A0A176RUV3_9GAMM|nr:hypothetical protein THIOM_004867 [Candidatus Thiomargarita nelsonii]
MHKTILKNFPQKKLKFNTPERYEVSEAKPTYVGGGGFRSALPTLHTFQSITTTNFI